MNGLGWWYSDCGQINLNGVNSNSQLNTGAVTAFTGIAWYPFFSSTSGRGLDLDILGGSWKTFKATEMKMSTTIERSNYFKRII